MYYLRFIIVLSSLLLFFNCKKDEKNSADNPKTANTPTTPEPALFEFLEPSLTNVSFKNEITETETFNILLYEYLYNGGGVAVGDINNDGLDDIYFSGNTVENKLYLNLGDFKFKDITSTAQVNGGNGFKTGVTMADVNNDGYLDIYVCKSAVNETDFRRNFLYINNGDLTFTESGKAYGLDDTGFSVQAYFFDADGDNDLDAFVLNHPSNMVEANSIKVAQNENGELTMVKPKSYEHISNRLYENNNNRFKDISEKSGVLNDAFSLSAVIGDFNNDFKPDIYVCNDYIKPDRLFINKGGNRFVDEIESYFNHTSFSSMGSDFADVNNDGNFDLLTLDMSPKENYRRKMMMMAQNYDKFEKMTTYQFGTQYSANALQINNGNNHFSNIAFLDNLAQTEWSWSTLLADFDNDGLKDIHITNGYKRDVTNNDYARYKMDVLQKQFNAKEISLKHWIEEIPSQPVSAFLFKNQGQSRFEDVSHTWNSGHATFSNGSAYSDLNNDGYLDLIVNNINELPFIMKNKGGSLFDNAYLSLELEYKKGKTNIGTLAKLTLTDGSVLTELYNPTRGFLSSSQHRLHFGIKKGLAVETLEVIWPDQQVQRIEKPELNQILNISRTSNPKYINSNMTSKYFEDATSKLSDAFTHTENDYIDFKREILLHHKYSEEGPAVAIADVNSDGLEDVYLGGALGFAGKLLLQTSSGGFKLEPQTDFDSDRIFEDTDALFFDANLDGHLDLYVVSGGNEHQANSKNYIDRLYINNGNGQFIKDTAAIPDIFVSGSVIKVHDIDNDGQLDVFIGGRVTPGRYPEIPKSYLLKNDNGVFKDVTSQWSQGLSNIGMVTDAEFSDINNDGIKELIVAGEWMSVSVFQMENNQFVNSSKNFNLTDTKGWWRSITVSDINNDGYNDILAGNLGLNSFFKASQAEPATLHYKDFDNNGSVDAILSTYVNNVSYPVHNRDRMLSHMVMLKKRFTRYDPYANATVLDLFTAEELKDVKVLEANHFEHTLFLNQGGQSFTLKVLANDTQISVLNDALILDLNQDGKKDIITGGNFYGTDAEFGRYDASIGTVLMHTEDSNFKSISSSESGFNIPGNVQHVKPITINKDQYILIVRNNDKCSLLKLK
ncbi:FG-GAP-like repeat-containing protein [Psychroserpens algicola]|uniref:FG-GAP-like repeat-containing protein n=1 Tax=Psychroserpens algicola TaxID=1719034 RepID=UPI001953E86C